MKGASTAGDKTNAGKIFVGGIAPGTSPEEVKELFSTYGVVSFICIWVAIRCCRCCSLTCFWPMASCICCTSSRVPHIVISRIHDIKLLF